MRNFADWIAAGFWLESERDAKATRPAFIHRKFRGLLAFESDKTSTLQVGASRWFRWLGSGDSQ
jgi:hypothetical protein